MIQYLTFLPADRPTFDLLKNGEKKLETRAGSPEYLKIRIGDNIEFSCGDDKFIKQVKKVARYKNLDELFAAYQPQEIMPGVFSCDEIRKIYASFPGYEQRIKEFGILVFELI